jgi:hypothetical protein
MFAAAREPGVSVMGVLGTPQTRVVVRSEVPTLPFDLPPSLGLGGGTYDSAGFPCVSSAKAPPPLSVEKCMKRAHCPATTPRRRSAWTDGEHWKCFGLISMKLTVAGQWEFNNVTPGQPCKRERAVPLLALIMPLFIMALSLGCV